MTIGEIVQELDAHFKIKQAEDFDNVGLLCGRTEQQISKILVAHDALESVIDEAIIKECNFIVCFHPILFSGLKKITNSGYVEKAILKALENRIGIYAVHTAWDNDKFGVNFGMANLLGLSHLKILQSQKNKLKKLQFYVPVSDVESVESALFSVGAGSIGNYDQCSFQSRGKGSFRPLSGADPFIGEVGNREAVEEVSVSVVYQDYLQNSILKALFSAHPYEEVAYEITALENENNHVGLGMIGVLEGALDEVDFLQRVKQKLNLAVIKHSNLINKKIKKVAVLGGSGAQYIRAAMAAECDAYLTGDLKYHDYFSVENKMLLCDVGHFESEQLVCQQIFDILSQKFSNFAVLKSSVKTNPVNYFI